MIYVASSWRNPYQPKVVELLRGIGLGVYDFRNPREGDDGFHWSEIDPAWEAWRTDAYRKALDHPIARDGFKSDMDALQACETCLLVLPCGRSAHLELGWAVGASKRTAIFVPDSHTEPELMYRMAGPLLVTWTELVEWAGREGDAHMASLNLDGRGVAAGRARARDLEAQP